MKSQGTKCFKCNQFGHIAKLCKETANITKEVACVSLNNLQQKQLKRVEIANQQFIAVIDNIA